MARRKPSRSLPSHRHHKPTGRGVVTLRDANTGRSIDRSTGPWGSPEAEERYQRILGEWLAGGRVVELPAGHARTAAGNTDPRAVTVTAVLRHHWRELLKRYDGKVHGHVFNIRAALRIARSIAGTLSAVDFGPRGLKAVRAKMIDRGWKRSTINKATRRIVAAFRDAAADQLVPGHLWRDLEAVRPLRAGEGGEESAPVLPPVPGAVRIARRHLCPQVRALVDLAILTGARMGELVDLRAVDFQTRGAVWAVPLASTRRRTAARPERSTSAPGPSACSACP